MIFQALDGTLTPLLTALLLLSLPALRLLWERSLVIFRFFNLFFFLFFLFVGDDTALPALLSLPPPSPSLLLFPLPLPSSPAIPAPSSPSITVRI